MTDIFISYSRKNRSWVKNLAAALEADGYDVWWDPEILPGQDYETIIRQVLETVKCVITVWSNDSIESTWVKAESSKGLERNILVPILYQDITPPMPFGRIHSADFRDWNGKSQDACYQHLLKAIDQHSVPSNPVTNLPQKHSPKWNTVLVFSLIAITAITVIYSILNIKQTTVIPNTEKQPVKKNIQNTEHLASGKTSSKMVDEEKQDTATNYIDNGDGTVTDRATNLMWKKCSEGLTGKGCHQGKLKIYNWHTATQTLNNVKFSGYSDWRLPTINELQTLIYCSNGVSQKEASEYSCRGKNKNASRYEHPTIQQYPFPNTKANVYWSSSAFAVDNKLAKFVNFRGGQNNSNLGNFKTNRFYIRLVRSR